MYDYIIAIDGGGTKTLGVLYALDGKEIRRKEVGFSNFAMNEVISMIHIESLLDVLVEGLTYDKLYIQMGIAGASKLVDKKTFINKLNHKYKATSNIVTDAIIGIHAIDKKADETLIMAIGGTGSVVLTYKGEEIHISGGWGQLLGDEGSAYHLVISAIKNIIYEYEYQIPYSPLSKHLLSVMEIDEARGITEYVYNRNKSSLAQLSIEVQKASKVDPYAVELLKNEGLMLSKQIINSYQKHVKDEAVLIALRGSFSQKALYVKETIINELKKYIPKFRIDTEGNEPVYGAYVLAKINIQKEQNNG